MESQESSSDGRDNGIVHYSGSVTVGREILQNKVQYNNSFPLPITNCSGREDSTINESVLNVMISNPEVICFS